MDENEQRRLRNDSLIVFLGAVAIAIAMLDETGRTKVSSQEFMKMVDYALAKRLERPDGPTIARAANGLRDLLDFRVRRMKSHISIAGMLNEIMDDIDRDNTFGAA